MGTEVEITVGRDKKKVPVSAASTRDLEWWRDNAKRDDIKTAVTRELARRANGGQPAPAPAAAIQRTPAASQSVELAGDNPAAVNQWFVANSAKFNLIAPSTVVQNLPEGCEIALSIIQLDPNPNNGDVYKTDGGKLAPTGTSLAKISQAAGVVWDTQNCGPIGDRTDSRYVEYHAVGGWRLFDGTFFPDVGHKIVDLRDGSDQIAGMTESQLAQARKHVLPLAESKAKNRVIRRLGLRSGYTAEELQKPFAIARLMWTGRTTDPELRRLFATMKAQQMIASSAALFGPPPPQPRHTIAHMLPPAHAAPFAPQGGSSVGLPAFDEEFEELSSPEYGELTAGQGATSTPLPQDRQPSLPNTEPAAGGKF